MSRGSETENWPVCGKWELMGVEVDGLERVCLLEPEAFGLEEDEAVTLSLSGGGSSCFWEAIDNLLLSQVHSDSQMGHISPSSSWFTAAVWVWE